MDSYFYPWEYSALIAPPQVNLWWDRRVENLGYQWDALTDCARTREEPDSTLTAKWAPETSTASTWAPGSHGFQGGGLSCEASPTGTIQDGVPFLPPPTSLSFSQYLTVMHAIHCFGLF